MLMTLKVDMALTTQTFRFLKYDTDSVCPIRMDSVVQVLLCNTYSAQIPLNLKYSCFVGANKFIVDVIRDL